MPKTSGKLSSRRLLPADRQKYDQREDRRSREGGNERRKPFFLRGMIGMTAADASFHSAILTDFRAKHQKIRTIIFVLLKIIDK